MRVTLAFGAQDRVLQGFACMGLAGGQGEHHEERQCGPDDPQRGGGRPPAGGERVADLCDQVDHRQKESRADQPHRSVFPLDLGGARELPEHDGGGADLNQGVKAEPG
jgi:hypothetical protein